MRGFLDATYALVVEEAASAGVPRGAAVEALEKALAEPLADEVSAEEMARQQRAKIVEQNEGALAKLAGMAALERGRQPRD